MNEEIVQAAAPADLVDANHILFGQGVVDAFGHVSVRDANRPSRFWLSRSCAPGMVTLADLVSFDLDGNAQGDTRKPYLERFIHAEIYRTRADVNAVVHSHSPAVIPFGIVKGIKLRPVCHMCGFLGADTPVFEIREVAGEGSDLLIRNRELGASLARTLGGDDVVLMRGHGVTVSGGSLKQATFRAIYTDLNAKLQTQALGLGSDITYLTADEAASAAASNDSQIDRAWDFWKRQLASTGAMQQ